MHSDATEGHVSQRVSRIRSLSPEAALCQRHRGADPGALRVVAQARRARARHRGLTWSATTACSVRRPPGGAGSCRGPEEKAPGLVLRMPRRRRPRLPGSVTTTEHNEASRIPWAELLLRVFRDDVLLCPRSDRVGSWTEEAGARRRNPSYLSFALRPLTGSSQRSVH